MRYIFIMANSSALKKQRATSIRLSPLADKLWERLADELGVSKQAVIEMAVRKLAKAEGIKPDAPLSDAFSQSGDEAFARIWDTPEEDEASAHLQKAI
jgi:hypothetical protein